MYQSTILYIEDDRELCEVVAAELEPTWKIVSASSLNELRDIFSTQFEFQLIITDFILPDGDGLDVLKLCRKINPSASCILTTGSISSEPRLKTLLSNPMTELLAKPFTIDSLREKITKLSSSHSRDKSSQHLS